MRAHDRIILGVIRKLGEVEERRLISIMRGKVGSWFASAGEIGTRLAYLENTGLVEYRQECSDFSGSIYPRRYWRMKA